MRQQTPPSNAAMPVQTDSLQSPQSRTYHTCSDSTAPLNEALQSPHRPEPSSSTLPNNQSNSNILDATISEHIGQVEMPRPSSSARPPRPPSTQTRASTRTNNSDTETRNTDSARGTTTTPQASTSQSQPSSNQRMRRYSAQIAQGQVVTVQRALANGNFDIPHWAARFNKQLSYI